MLSLPLIAKHTLLRNIICNTLYIIHTLKNLTSLVVLLSLPWYYSVSTLGDTISISHAFPATVDCILKLWTKNNHFLFFLLEYFITQQKKISSHLLIIKWRILLDHPMFMISFRSSQKNISKCNTVVFLHK